MKETPIDIRKYLIKVEKACNSEYKSDNVLNTFFSNEDIDLKFQSIRPSILADIVIIGEIIDDVLIKKNVSDIIYSENIMKVMLIESMIAYYFYKSGNQKYEDFANRILNSCISKFCKYFVPSSGDYSYEIFLFMLYFLKHNFIKNEYEILKAIDNYLLEMDLDNLKLEFIVNLKEKLTNDLILTYLDSIENLEPSQLKKKINSYLSIFEFHKAKELIMKNKEQLFTVNTNSLLGNFLFLDTDYDTKKIVESLDISMFKIDYRTIYLNPAYFEKTFNFFDNKLPDGINLEHLIAFKQKLIEKITNEYHSQYLMKENQIDSKVAICLVVLLNQIGFRNQAKDVLHNLIYAIQLEVKSLFSIEINDKLNLIRVQSTKREKRNFKFISNKSSSGSEIFQILHSYSKIKEVCDVTNFPEYSKIMNSNFDLLILELDQNQLNPIDLPFLFLDQFKKHETHNLKLYSNNKDIFGLETSFISLLHFTSKLRKNSEYFRGLLIEFLREIAYIQLNYFQEKTEL